jgi:uncharacterized RDD family membrane protein YckC
MSAAGDIENEKFTREMITPEGVDLRLQLGDAGQRVSAFFLDVLIILAAMAALTVLVLLAAAATRLRGAEYLGVIWILGFFLLRNFYFIAFELTPRAATPGKRAIGLRVATRDGGPLSANAIFARNAMRELEVFLPLTFMAAARNDLDAAIGVVGLCWCAVFALFPLFNRDRLRVGDLVAGTWVVVAPRRDLNFELTAADEAARFSEAALEAYGIKELTILENVLRKKDAATLKAVAERIRRKIDFTQPMGDEEFLSSYYVALRGRLETRLLFGRRRRDKHDTA